MRESLRKQKEASKLEIQNRKRNTINIFKRKKKIR